MNYPTDLKYTENDEWVRVEDASATVGVSDYAQDQLSDVVYVEVIATVGDSLKQGEAFGSVESVKAAADVYMPVGGTITEINEALGDIPELVNSDPYDAAWIIKLTLTDPSELDGLMDAVAYEAYCNDREN